MLMRIHVCFLDRECRSVGAPKRVYVDMGRLGSLSIGERTLGWLPVLGFLPPLVAPRWRWFMWWFVCWTPAKTKRGYLAMRWPEFYGLRRDEGVKSEVTKEV